MGEDRAVCAGLDTHKAKIAVAVAEPGRLGEVRFVGEIANQPEAVRQLFERLGAKHGRLSVCYEAGPCGYGLHRQITALGHDCTVVAPSLVPREPGERVRTNRRDAVTLARLHRAGELTAVWVPDPAHEAMRDLVRARTAAMEVRSRIHHLQPPAAGPGCRGVALVGAVGEDHRDEREQPACDAHEGRGPVPVLDAGGGWMAALSRSPSADTICRLRQPSTLQKL